MPVNPTPLTPLTDPPSRADPATFAAKGDAFLGGFPTLQTEINTVIDITYDNAVEAAASAATASAAEIAAVGAANYQGDWNSSTTYSRGQSVTYNNDFYYSKVNSNLNNQPDVSPTQWAVSAINDSLNGTFPTLSVTGNTTIGDAAVDTLTINAQTWSAPNGLILNTSGIAVNSNNDIGFGPSIGGTTTYGANFRVIDAYASLGAYSQVRSNNVRADFYADETSGTTSIGSKTAHPFIVRTTDGECARFTTGKFFKASNTSGYGSVAGLGDLSTNASHNFQSNQNNSTVASINSSTGSSVYNYDSHLPTGAAGFHFQGNVNASATVRILANGNIENTNNSYGAISDRKLKNLLQKEYGADYYDRFKQIQFWTYTLLNDPTNQKMLGVVAQELQDIFPGLVASSLDMEEVKKIRTITKQVQRTQTEHQTRTTQDVKEIDGVWTLVETTETVDVKIPVFEEHQVYDQDGKPVMQLVKRGVPEIIDADGNVLQPSVDPVYTPFIHRVPVMDDVEEQEEYIEYIPTGTETLSVKYSILYQIAAMVTQELQFRNDEHTVTIGQQAATIGDQAKQIALLTARIEALENN